MRGLGRLWTATGGGVCVLAMAGCLSVGPDYLPPEAEIPEAWQSAAPAGTETTAEGGGASMAEWWKVFQDPKLDALLVQVRERNGDLAAAAARMEAAAAQVGMARADLVPAVAATGGAGWDRQTEEAHAHTTYPDNPAWLYQAGLSLQWELDVWGRVRRGLEAARGDLDAVLEDTRGMLVMLQAQAAETYVGLRTAQQQLEFAEKNAGLQQDTLELTKGRYEAGLTSELDVRQAEMNLAATRAQIPRLRAAIDAHLNSLCTLTGQLPGALDSLRVAAPVPSADALPTSVPANVVRQRPDIRGAERRLAAQTARIGVAKADYFPKLTLNGSFAFVSTYGDTLFEESAQRFNIGPGLEWAVFTAGKVRNRVRAQEAMTRVALEEWRQTVRTAYAECESALSAHANATETRAALEEAVRAAEQSVELASTLYRDGLTDFQNVLDMQQQLASHQDGLAQSRGGAATSLVEVYRAFGGGWSDEMFTTATGAGAESKE